MKKSFKGLAMLIMTLGMLFAMPLVSSAASYYVTTTTVNMRKGAGSDYAVNIELPPECVVKVTSTKNSKWYKVTYRNNEQQNFKGYIYSAYLKKATIYKTTANLNIRATTSSSSRVVKTIPKGKQVIIVDTYTGAWYKAVYFTSSGNVYRGYTYQDYLKKKGAKTGKYVTTEAVYMHTGRSMDSPAVIVVPGNKTVTVTNVSHGKWYYCKYKSSSGKTYKGYISNVCLKKK